MSEIRKHICNRCGEEIKTGKLKAILNFTKNLKLFNI